MFLQLRAKKRDPQANFRMEGTCARGWRQLGLHGKARDVVFGYGQRFILLTLSGKHGTRPFVLNVPRRTGSSARRWCGITAFCSAYGAWESLELQCKWRRDILNLDIMKSYYTFNLETYAITSDSKCISFDWHSQVCWPKHMWKASHFATTKLAMRRKNSQSPSVSL